MGNNLISTFVDSNVCLLFLDHNLTFPTSYLLVDSAEKNWTELKVC